jgi:peroxiredoxin
MNKALLITTAAAAFSFLQPHGLAADAKSDAKPAAAGAETKRSAKTELQELVGKVQAKLQQGKSSEADLAAELKEFDALLAQHKDEKTDDVAQIAFMKALLYIQVFENTDKAKELMAQLKQDFPETTQGKRAGDVIASIDRQAEAKKIQEGLVTGAKFPDFNEKDLAGKPLSIANYKGKIVLVDFWATWCGPCVTELPNVLAAYEKYHDKGFEIIGISLDKDKDALTSFIEKRKMPWPQYFDGKGWENKVSSQYGIQSIPATFLLDGEGKIIAKDQELRGAGLVKAVGEALAKK